MSYDVWVDFNEISMAELNIPNHPCDGHLHSVLAYSPHPEKVVKGARLIGGDGDGNVCEVSVLDIFEFMIGRIKGETLLCLQMHEGTFGSAAHT